VELFGFESLPFAQPVLLGLGSRAHTRDFPALCGLQLLRRRGFFGGGTGAAFAPFFDAALEFLGVGRLEAALQQLGFVVARS